MDKFTVHTGVAAPLRRSDVDTDQIIPAEYLKRVTRTGFEDGLFNAWRNDPAFVLNNPAYAGASDPGGGPPLRRRFVAGARRLGAGRLRASGRSSPRRSATSSATTPSRAACSRWCCRRRWSTSCGTALTERPGTEVTVDLVQRQVRIADASWPFALDDHSRWRLLEGLDDIGLTLRHADAIGAFEAARPSFKPVVA